MSFENQSSSEGLMDIIEDDPSSDNFGAAMDIDVEVKDEKFQKEHRSLKLLPYYHELQIETEEYLEKILNNLTKAILAQDFQLGFILYSKSLRSFIYLYGYKFTKEQHIKLIKLYYDLVTMDTCPLNLIPDVAEMLNCLLSKAKLIGRDDILLKWRPLYETLDRFIYHRKYTLSLSVSQKIENLLKETVRKSNLYFGDETFEEVVEQFRPMLYPVEPKMIFALDMLKRFLPFCNPKYSTQIHEFVKELLAFCDGWNNHPGWEWSMVSFMATAGWSMVGIIDWEPYIPLMYARLIKNLELPVHFKGGKNAPGDAGAKSFEFAGSARWIISTLGNNPSSIKQLRNFLKTLETYYNPSNYGKWTIPLSALLNELVDAFTLRLKRERYLNLKRRWWVRIPPERKLTDEEIDAFVEMTSALVLEFYLDIHLCSFILKNLATIRPNLVIPAILEKYSTMVETLVEPRKYMITLRWVLVVTHSMLSSRKGEDNYDGRNLIIPFLFSLLPAVDPNDMNKTFSALACLHVLFGSFSAVDSSHLASNFEDEYERELCLSTASLEDFLLQFLDRIFSLVENRTLENTRMADNRAVVLGGNIEDISLEKHTWALFLRIAAHSSTAICKVLSAKIVSFALNTSLETDVSGRLFASVFQAFVIARPEMILPTVLPVLCSKIESEITDDVLNDEELDKALLFNLLLLSYVVETNGVELLKFRHCLEPCLFKILKLNGKKGYSFGSNILRHLLRSLVYIYPTESRFTEADLDSPNYASFNDWGKYWSEKKVDCHWHVPNDDEFRWAKAIFANVYNLFVPKLEYIGSLKEGNEDLNKILLKSMQVLISLYDGISTLLQFWDTTPIYTNQTTVDLSCDPFCFGYGPNAKIVVPGTTDGNVMKKYFDIYSEIKSYLETHKSDDTEAFVALIKGFDSLVFPSIDSEKLSILWTQGNSNSNRMDNTLDPKKKNTRGALIYKAFNLHLKRVRTSTCTSWTESHLALMNKLFELCVNRYAKVRCAAQARFCRIVESFGGLIARNISHLFIAKLQSGVNHHEYKGTLYTMMGSKNTMPFLHNSWTEIRNLWVGLIQSPFSEKDSVIKCMDKIRSLISQNFVYSPLSTIAPRRVLESSKTLVNPEVLVSFEERTTAWEENEQIFTSLISDLLSVGTNPKNHWRKHLMCAHMLGVLIIKDIPLPKPLIQFFFEALVSPVIEIRLSALNTVAWILSFGKRVYTSITINTQTGIVFKPGENIKSVLQYKRKEEHCGYELFDENNAPLDFPLFVHKTYHGYSALPRLYKMKIAPTSFKEATDQPETQKRIIEVTEDYFNNPTFLKSLLSMWSLEEKRKGMSTKRSAIMKFVTRNNGPDSLTQLLSLLPEMVKEKDQWKQRCLSDIFSGILLGMKLWDDEKIDVFWPTIKPIINECIDNVTQETTAVWNWAITFPTANRDPKKMKFFIEFLKERFLKSLFTVESTSVEAVKDMTHFNNVASNIQWRGGELYADILNIIKTYFFVTPVPYVNVRVQLGRLMGDVFEWDSESASSVGCAFSPKLDPFLTQASEMLTNITTEAEQYHANEGDADSPQNAQIRVLLLKFKTVLEWVLSVCWDFESTVPPRLYEFIPLLCHFENYEPDPEIAQLAAYALSGLARTLIQPRKLDYLLDILGKAVKCISWRARLCVLEFLKVFCLNNGSLLGSKREWSSNVLSLVLILLKDRKLEVREAASQILCGFIHCHLIEEPMELLNKFKKEAAVCGKRQRAMAKAKIPLKPEEVDAGHSAVLGLCAFVDTHPYDVPTFLPDVLVILTTHLHDAQPIPATIRKCLSNFRRTHHDNWTFHKNKFTEDELTILTDIFVSPCYYA